MGRRGKKSLFPLLGWILGGDELCILMMLGNRLSLVLGGTSCTLQSPSRDASGGTREQRGQAGAGSEGGRYGCTLHGGFYFSQGKSNPACRAPAGTNPGRAGSNPRPNIARAAERGSQQPAGLRLAGAALGAH